MLKFIGKTIKATILNLIVALFIILIILGTVKFLFGAKIEETVSLASKVSIKLESKNNVKTVEINENEGITSYPNYGDNYAKIKIPSINVDLPVYFGDTLEILKKGVGHSTGSYFPGEGGSIIYMGHNAEKTFRRFGEVQKGDEIIVEASYGTYKYKIYDMKLIKETDIDELKIQKEKEILMVYTCYPFSNIGYAKQRYVLYAELDK